MAVRTAISKPYLSLIETGRVPNPPSDEKLRRLEQTLGFPAGELVSQAHLHRTPRDVRAVLQKLIQQGREKATPDERPGSEESRAPLSTAKAAAADLRPALPGEAARERAATHAAAGARVQGAVAASLALQGINLDDAYLSGVLQELVGQSAAVEGRDIESLPAQSVPVVNRVSAGYPKDFTDLGYPPRAADEYVSCPDVFDRDAFAARVHGDSMTPKYREGDVVIFSPAAPWRDGSDCFVRFEDGQTTFKRVFMEKAENGAAVLRLQPRNERYRPQVIPSEKVSGLYKAVYQYRRVDDE